MRFSHEQIAKCVRIKGGLSIGILTLIIGTPKEPQMIKVCFVWMVCMNSILIISLEKFKQIYRKLNSHA
jgi:hypothetical protein